MKAVLDTNILIDYLNGHEEAAREIERYGQPVISRITWLEVLAGTGPADEEVDVRAFLATFALHELDGAVAEEVVALRRKHRLRLPDAIVLATAHVHECMLVTRNTKDFDASWPEIREPYRL